MKNFGFLLNHLGLWITLVAAGLGSGDQKSVSVDLLEESDFSNTGVFENQQKIDLPFSMKLIDFNIEFYNSKIAVADQAKGEILQKHAETLPLIYKGFESTLIDWKIKVKEFIPFAIKTDNGYTPADKPGSVTAAFVETKNNVTGDTASGWITSSSMMYEPKFLDLKRSRLLFLTDPEPKKFESLVLVRDKEGREDTIKLEVNKPHRINGWKVYQLGYDTQMGKYSKRSVIEAVRDPWLPVVYFGILMLLAGAVYLFWLGRPVSEE
jgi:cytochrome c biogenesis protein ResB